jgi:hypothetical protein
VTFKSLLPLVTLGLAGISSMQAQGGAASPDPAFSAVPFERWLAEGEPTSLRWTVRVGAAALNNHQRLQTRVEIQMDGNELVSRRGHGELGVMIQFEDSAKRLYQTHGGIDLQEVKDDTGKSNVQYLQDAMVLPGDYRVSVVIFDAKTRDHWAEQKTLHVNPLHNDPLPGAWKNLPAVELLRAMEPPDSWYIPDVSSHLQLPVAAHRPVRVEVLMNASPSGPSRGLNTGTANSRNLANLVPALKVLSQMEVAGGSLHVTLLDISKRHIIFEQDAVRQLDWTRLRDALTAADPNKIDVKSLEHREQNAPYFLQQVRERLTPPGSRAGAADEPVRVLIVLAAPTTLDSGEKNHAAELETKPQGLLYFVRYHLAPERMPLGIEPFSRMGRRNYPGSMQQPAAQPEAFDSLQSVLKPLQPRVFDVYSPDQFRKALSGLLDEIARL